MKKTLVMLVALTLVAGTAFASSLNPTTSNVEKAEASNSAAKNFSPCPTVRPDEGISGNVVIYVKDGKSFQYGSSMTSGEAYDMYCTGGGGE